MLVSVICILWLPLVLAAREEDRVTNLPGLDPQPEFNHYAGYLNATGTNRLFYWFVESQGNPAEDPLVVWFNGGPGCSSLIGFLTELGPWRVRPDGSGLEWFEYSWNRVANMIFLESFQCVGFSYPGDGNCTSNDQQSAADNHAALRDFLDGFPEFRDRDFYIAGQSYAGVYVPRLANLIKDDPDFNFQGFAVGNGVSSNRITSSARVYWSYARSIIGEDLWLDLVNECCVDGNSSDCNFFDNENEQCEVVYTRFQALIWSAGLNPYNIYHSCFGFDGPPNKFVVQRHEAGTIEVTFSDGVSLDKSTLDEMLAFQESIHMPLKLINLTGSPLCTDDSDRFTYLNTPEVREALHTSDQVETWFSCNPNRRSYYTQQTPDTTDIVKEILDAGHRATLYAGDMDAAVDHMGIYWFAESLGYPEVTPYQNWFAVTEDGTTQIAGYFVQYENLTFLTVKGSGHNVPEDKPIAAFTLWEKFIRNEAFP